MKTEEDTEHYMTLPIFYIVLSALPYFFIFWLILIGASWGDGGITGWITPNNSVYSLKNFLEDFMLPTILTIACFFLMRWMNKKAFGGLFDFLASVPLTAILCCSGFILSTSLCFIGIDFFTYFSGGNLNDLNQWIHVLSDDAKSIIILVTTFFTLPFYWLGIPLLSIYKINR